jgi:hypothetical protein
MWSRNSGTVLEYSNVEGTARCALASYTYRRHGGPPTWRLRGEASGLRPGRAELSVGVIATMKARSCDKVMKSQPIIVLNKRALFSHATNENAINLRAVPCHQT